MFQRSNILIIFVDQLRAASVSAMGAGRPRRRTSTVSRLVGRRSRRLLSLSSMLACTGQLDEWARRGVPEPGDVIFTREAPVGEDCCLVPADGPVCLGQRIVFMKLRREEDSTEFLVHMIYRGPPRPRIQSASQGSTVGYFNMGDIGWMRGYKPPLSEQREIVKHLSEAARDSEDDFDEFDAIPEEAEA